MGCRGRGNVPFPCSSPKVTRLLRQRPDHSLVTVKPPDRKCREVDRVNPIVHGQQPDRFSAQSFAHKHALVLPRKLPPFCHSPHPGSGHACRIRPHRWSVYRTRRLHLQRFVRPLFVVLAPESIECSLLRPPVRRRWRRCLLLQRAMHPLVPPVLFRMARRDPLRHDPQLHPPHRQPRQPRNRSRRKRRPVVGSNRPRQPALPKRSFENPAHVLAVGLLHLLAAQQIPAVRVADRQRIDPRSILCFKPPLEIRTPHPVRSIRRCEWLLVGRRAPPLLAPHHQSLAHQHPADRACRRPGGARSSPPQNLLQLPRPPTHVLPPQL